MIKRRITIWLTVSEGSVCRFGPRTSWWHRCLWQRGDTCQCPAVFLFLPFYFFIWAHSPHDGTIHIQGLSLDNIDTPECASPVSWVILSSIKLGKTRRQGISEGKCLLPFWSGMKMVPLLSKALEVMTRVFVYAEDSLCVERTEGHLVGRWA